MGGIKEKKMIQIKENLGDIIKKDPELFTRCLREVDCCWRFRAALIELAKVPTFPVVSQSHVAVRPESPRLRPAWVYCSAALPSRGPKMTLKLSSLSIVSVGKPAFLQFHPVARHSRLEWWRFLAPCRRTCRWRESFLQVSRWIVLNSVTILRL